MLTLPCRICHLWLTAMVSRQPRIPLFFCTVILAIGATAAVASNPPAAKAPPDSSSDLPPIPVTITPEMENAGGTYFGHLPDPAKTRHYYLAAEPELWDYAPMGQDPVCGKPLPSTVQLFRTGWKIRYAQYAGSDFSARILPSERLGILGPVLRGTTGEYIAVTVLNRSWRPISLHAHGVKYDKDSEGSYYKPNPGLGASIAPGAKFTYVWHLDEASGPRSDEPSSKAWLYHSHVTGEDEINLGLFGLIIVTDPARARTDGTPNDVDREMAAAFTIFDETLTADQIPDADDLPPGASAGPVQRTWAEAQQYAEQGERHTINGRAFGNIAGFEMNEGERVRWYLLGLGSEKDFHTAHWHGMRVLEDGRRRTDVVELLPGSMKIADMVADNPGTWMLHCHVGEHMAQGMFAKMVVHPAGASALSTEPKVAFFGMPEAAQTLNFDSAELVFTAGKPEETELDLSGKVTVPDPFPTVKQPIVAQFGSVKVEFRPDASGLCVVRDGLLVLKNTSQVGNGVVKGGILKFDLSLKGAAIQRELEQLHLLENGQLVPNASIHLDLVAGTAHHHSATTNLKLVSP
jgi:hypothetical protein